MAAASASVRSAKKLNLQFEIAANASVLRHRAARQRNLPAKIQRNGTKAVGVRGIEVGICRSVRPRVGAKGRDEHHAEKQPPIAGISATATPK